MRRVIENDIGIAEVEFEAEVQPRVPGTSRHLVERIVLQRIHAAQAGQPPRIPDQLLACPIVLRLDPCVFVLDRRLVWIAELIGGRQDGGALNAGRIEIRDQPGGVERFVCR